MQKLTKEYPLGFLCAGYGHTSENTIDAALDMWFKKSSYILEELNKNNNNPPIIYPEEEKYYHDDDVEVVFENEISEKILEGFNKDLDKRSVLQLQTLLLRYKNFAYTRITQHEVIYWNEWKIKKIKEKLKIISNCQVSISQC